MLTINHTYRIYPTTDQRAVMLDWLETCRRLYNHCLRDLKDWINSRKCMVDRCSINREYIMSPDIPFPNYLEQKRQLTQWKKNNPYYKSVYSQVTQDVVKRMHNTWQAFKNRGFGFPRFKKYGQYRSFLFPQFKENPIKRCDPNAIARAVANGAKRDGVQHSEETSESTSLQELRESAPRQGNIIKLPKIGEVPINLHRPIPDGFTVKGVRIVSRARNTQWYAVVTIQCDVTVPEFKPYGRAIGVDIGLESFLVTSDNFTVKPARFFRDLQSRLKELQRKVSRKRKRSKNWEKGQIEVARLHHKIANSRKNFHLNIAHKLCDLADSIYVEDIDFRVSAKGFLGKEMLDGGFGQFRQLLSWVCWKRGKYMGQVDHKYTSQICPECGTHTGKKELSQRQHNCSECGYSTSRDHAGARVILNRGLGINVVPRDAGERKQPADCVLSGAIEPR